MTFAHAWVLLLIVIPVVMCVWLLHRRSWGVAVPYDHRDHRPRWVINFLLRFLELIPLLILIIVLIIIARPQVQRIPRDERVLNNILICMDVSASMSSENRFDMAKKAIEEFINSRNGDALGFTLFGTQQIRWTPLTKDIATIKRALPFANPANQPPFMGGTMIGAALRFCRDNMEREAAEGDRLLLLVSDGVSADVNSGNSSELADEMKAANIAVYHIHVGTGERPVDVVDIATATGGESFVATDAGGLKRIFQHIDRMKPARFKPMTAIPMDYYQPFAFIGLCLFGLYGLWAFGLRFTPW